MRNNNIIDNPEKKDNDERMETGDSLIKANMNIATEKKLVRDVTLDANLLALSSLDAVNRLNRTEFEDKNVNRVLNRLVSVSNLQDMRAVSNDISSLQKETNSEDQIILELVGMIISGISNFAETSLDRNQWETENQHILSAIHEADYYIRNVIAVKSPPKRDLCLAVTSYIYSFWLEVGDVVKSGVKD